MYKTKMFIQKTRIVGLNNVEYYWADYSQYVLQGDSITENITQELDSGEITLYGLAQKECFLPATKVRIVFFDVDNNGIIETRDMLVDRDIVEQPIMSDSEYYDHHIYLIEPSVVAQKRIVDNISATYKLKDVSLKQDVQYPDVEIDLNINDSYFNVPTYSINNGNAYGFGVGDYAKMLLPIGYVDAFFGAIGKYFKKVGKLKYINRNNDEYDTLYNNIGNFSGGDDKYYARFILPKIQIVMGTGGRWSNYVEDELDVYAPMYASLEYIIKEYDVTDDSNYKIIQRGDFISNTELAVNVNGYADRPINFSTNFETECLNGEWLLADITYPSTDEWVHFYYRKFVDKSAPDTDYTTEEIEIKANKKYVIEVSLKKFDDYLPEEYSGERRHSSTSDDISKFIRLIYTTNFETIDDRRVPTGTEFGYVTRYTENNMINNKFSINQLFGDASIYFYDVNDLSSIIYASATKYSALSLLQKAIVNSATYEKENGVCVIDVDANDYPFVIDNEFKQELATTNIIENFYNQKNLWEIMLEVGFYIHAIPELKFTDDNKYMITFNRLGRTDLQDMYAEKISVVNSRSIEDYIATTSSYISNMVQLGGYIDEWVAPKTTNETQLVSNNTVSILTTKPIIELLKIEAKNVTTGSVADITEYVFEKNVYNTLGLDFDVIPNKGLALYYELGKNVIGGCQYQLPQEFKNIYTDYAIKKVIYTAFYGYPTGLDGIDSSFGEYWTDLKVSDYMFRVVYRTKDDVRLSHTRPDLRKYLLSSPYDRYPQYNQFNNQTDILVDSIKFGSNMYGKLIKVGNNEYTISEWNDNYQNVKHKGELYKINNELYYVAKVKHTRYNSFILSDVTFSKDYNELSMAIGIPSEPRFYEISEQSAIRRDVAINNYLLLENTSFNVDDFPADTNNGYFFFDMKYLRDLIFTEGVEFPKYVVSVFKGDKDNIYGSTFGETNNYIEIMTPLNTYSSGTTLTFEWDMIDNYSAGDKVKNVGVDERITFDERAYKSLEAVRYTDIYGKSALLDFYILQGDISFDSNELNNMPNSPIKTKNNNADDTRKFVGEYDILATNVKNYDENFNGRGIVLAKDCREAISINYNMQLITNSDRYVVSPFVFLPNKKNVKAVLLRNEVNKLSNGYINYADIIVPYDIDMNKLDKYFDITIGNVVQQNTNWADYSTLNASKSGAFYISFNSMDFVNIGHFNGDENFEQVKSIAIICDVAENPNLDSDAPVNLSKTKFVIARNTADLDTGYSGQARSDWWFGKPIDDYYENRRKDNEPIRE